MIVNYKNNYVQFGLGKTFKFLATNLLVSLDLFIIVVFKIIF